MVMKNLLTKLASAKAEIKATNLKKEGRNTYSNYDYFTPSQVEYLVATACKNNNLLTVFNLLRNELGVIGQLTVYDIESGENLTVQMATDIPEIKATNTAQQIGGCLTYTERYLKMSLFGITDNQLDFDTTENTRKRQEAKKAQEVPDLELEMAIADTKRCKNVKDLQELWNSTQPYQSNKKFIAAVNVAKNQLQK